MGSQKTINLIIMLMAVVMIWTMGSFIYNTYMKQKDVSNVQSNFKPYEQDEKNKENIKKIKELQKQNSPSPMDEALIESEGDAVPKGLFIIENCYEPLFEGLKTAQYEIIKVKLKNVCQNEIASLYNNVKSFDAKAKTDFFNKNKASIETNFGITNVNDFIKLTDSFKFIDSNVKSASLSPNTISKVKDKVTFDFDVILESGNRGTYKATCELLKSSENQGAPYMTIMPK